MISATKNQRYYLLAVIIVAILALLFGLWFQHNMGMAKRESVIGLDLTAATVLPQPKQLRPFQLIDDHNKSFTNANLKGHWSLLFFGFTNCPELCPTTLSTLNKMYQILQDKKSKIMPQVVFVSVDPERDTPKKIAEYLASFNKNFIGVTGSQQQLDQFTQELNVMYAKVISNQDGENYSIDHSGTIIMIDPQAKFYAVFSTPHDPKILAKDVSKIIDNSN